MNNTDHLIVQVNFLRVGHTHNDVDGDFGSISSTLRRQDALVPHEMEEVYRNSVAKSVTARSGRKTPMNTLLSSTSKSSEAVMVESVPDFEAVYSHEVSSTCPCKGVPKSLSLLKYHI